MFGVSETSASGSLAHLEALIEKALVAVDRTLWPAADHIAEPTERLADSRRAMVVSGEWLSRVGLLRQASIEW